MTLPENKVTIGDGHNGIRMYDGEDVIAVHPSNGQKTFLGVLRFSEGGVPYLDKSEREKVIDSLN